jgi:hypothetical protein
MAKLAGAIAAHPGARLSGTFTDVVKGVVVSGAPGQKMTGGIDTGFPQTYPTGTVDRGVLVSSLPAAERRLAREAIESFASFPGSAISAPLLAAYLEPKALEATYVGYAGDTALSGNDGGHVWAINAVDPNGAADCSQKWVFDGFADPAGGSWSPPAFATDANGRPLVILRLLITSPLCRRAARTTRSPSIGSGSTRR